MNNYLKNLIILYSIPTEGDNSNNNNNPNDLFGNIMGQLLRPENLNKLIGSYWSNDGR